MKQKTYNIVSAIIFLVVFLGHLTRAVSGWQVVVNGWAVPLWASWAGFIVAGILCYSGYKLSK